MDFVRQYWKAIAAFLCTLLASLSLDAVDGLTLSEVLNDLAVTIAATTGVALFPKNKEKSNG